MIENQIGDNESQYGYFEDMQTNVMKNKVYLDFVLLKGEHMSIKSDSMTFWVDKTFTNGSTCRRVSVLIFLFFYDSKCRIGNKIRLIMLPDMSF